MKTLELRPNGSKVRRYLIDRDGEEYESGLGPYVFYSDYEKLQKAYEILRGAVELIVFNGCLSGDCPHDKQVQCYEEINKIIHDELMKAHHEAEEILK